MRIPFRKMHGAGNDFILIDDRALTFPMDDKDWIAALCSRRHGIGGEGLILVQPSAKARFRMRFFNPDGHEAEMCGNGVRCVARFAFDAGIGLKKAQIETLAGVLETEICGDAVLVRMPPPKDLRMDEILDLPGGLLRYGFVNTGVPHAVVRVDDLDGCDVSGMGRAVREHPVFAPDGTNVNFTHVTGNHSLCIRTYERGVEAETGACGTGAVAAALVASGPGGVEPPVEVTVAGGQVLTVDFEIEAGRFEHLTLLGPAVHIFDGEVEYGSAPK